MTSDGRCVHDMLPGQCAICLGHDKAADVYDDLLIERFLIARYDGRCAVCKEPFVAGDDIGKVADGYGYACRKCCDRAGGAA